MRASLPVRLFGTGPGRRGDPALPRSYHLGLWSACHAGVRGRDNWGPGPGHPGLWVSFGFYHRL